MNDKTSWETNRSSANPEILRTLSNAKAYYPVLKSSPLDSKLNRMNTGQAVPSLSSRSILLLSHLVYSSKWFFPSRFPIKLYTFLSSPIPGTWLSQVILLRYHHPNNTRKVRSSAVGWGTALQVGRSRVRFPIGSWRFFVDLILPFGLWVWSRLSL